MADDIFAKGGNARAKILPRERRQEIASLGGQARWADLPYATHEGDLKLGDALIPSAVLSDKRRVLTQSAVMKGTWARPASERKEPLRW